MGLFGNQLANVVEWEQFNDEMIFWKWSNKEIKKGSKLIIRPGQDAIFLFNGKVEGVFENEGSYDIASQIVPFLSTLKGFKFGFNSGMRAEVLFVNTKEITVKWGTKNAINIPAPGLPGGMPIRAFGTMACKVDNHNVLIDKIAGIKQQFNIDDVKERVISMLDQLLMKWIAREGKDMFNLQVNSFEIGNGIKEDMDFEMRKIGISIPSFWLGLMLMYIFSVKFKLLPIVGSKGIKSMQEKAAGQSMVGDVNKYTQMSMADSMENGRGAGNMAGSMAGMQMGMMMGQQMANQMNQSNQMQNSQQSAGNAAAPKFCPECGTKTNGSKFCPECGTKLY